MPCLKKPLEPAAEPVEIPLERPASAPGIPVEHFPVGGELLAREPFPRVEPAGNRGVHDRVPLCLVADAVSRFREISQILPIFEVF